MKQYTVYFSEPVSLKFQSKRWNSETQKWEDFTNEVLKTPLHSTLLYQQRSLSRLILISTKALALQKFGEMGIGKT